MSYPHFMGLGTPQELRQVSLTNIKYLSAEAQGCLKQYTELRLQPKEVGRRDGRNFNLAVVGPLRGGDRLYPLTSPASII